tara:strand:+ start:32 stop:586 length:555 start_codon:yes stop_codon:yes gene_type:complete
MTLLDLLVEKSSKKKDDYRVVPGPARALLAGRPSKNIKDLKLRVASDPSGLIDDLGIESSSINEKDSSILFLHEAFGQMISNATGDNRARLLQDLFQQPELVQSRLTGRKAILIKLSGEGIRLAQADARRFLRTYAFWFSSTTEALQITNSQLNLNLTVNVKFQYIEGENAILVFKSRRSWTSL